MDGLALVFIARWHDGGDQRIFIGKKRSVGHAGPECSVTIFANSRHFVFLFFTR